MKNLFVTLGLSLAVGLGVGAGLSFGKGEIKEVKAATSDADAVAATTYYYHGTDTGKADKAADCKQGKNRRAHSLHHIHGPICTD